MSTTVIPTVAIQEVYSGGQFTGVASNGTHSEEALYRGRQQFWIGGTVGGEFSAPEQVGMRVEQVFWYLESTVVPEVKIYLVDPDNVEYLVDTQNAASSEWQQPNSGILVPPDFKIRVKSDQAIDGVLSVVAEDTGIGGDGVSDEYRIPLAHGRVDPTTVSLVAKTVTFTDPAGDGVLVGVGGSGGSGTINYVTGVVNIELSDPTDFNGGVHAIATYDYNQFGRVGIMIHQGWGLPAIADTGLIGKENLPPSMQRA